MLFIRYRSFIKSNEHEITNGIANSNRRKITRFEICLIIRT